MMKREGKRGEVPVEDELPFNPVRRTEARTVGGGASVQEDEDGQTTRQIKKKKKKKRKISRFLTRVSDILTFTTL